MLAVVLQIADVEAVLMQIVMPGMSAADPQMAGPPAGAGAPLKDGQLAWTAVTFFGRLAVTLAAQAQALLTAVQMATICERCMQDGSKWATEGPKWSLIASTLNTATPGTACQYAGAQCGRRPAM